jgi:hypothetical protein
MATPIIPKADHGQSAEKATESIADTFMAGLQHQIGKATALLETMDETACNVHNELSRCAHVALDCINQGWNDASGMAAHVHDAQAVLLGMEMLAERTVFCGGPRKCWELLEEASRLLESVETIAPVNDRPAGYWPRNAAASIDAPTEPPMAPKRDVLQFLWQTAIDHACNTNVSDATEGIDNVIASLNAMRPFIDGCKC